MKTYKFENFDIKPSQTKDDVIVFWSEEPNAMPGCKPTATTWGWLKTNEDQSRDDVITQLQALNEFDMEFEMTEFGAINAKAVR